MHEILNDFELKMNTKVSEKDIKEYSGGATDAVVFSIKEKYLIKKTTKQELDVYNKFFSIYKSYRYQKLYYINYDLNYVCLSFTKGDKFDSSIDPKTIIDILYDTTSNYKKIDYDGYGYLSDNHKTWTDFLKDEIGYSLQMIDGDKTYDKRIQGSLDIISSYKIDKYLLHGDFGTHNFIVNNEDLYYIDPMGLVGDPLYDFYFAIFSNTYIFGKLRLDGLLTYFDRDTRYKKAMIFITYIIRLCRSYKYDREAYSIYLEYLKNNEDFFRY